MLRFTLVRLGQAILVLFVVATVVFLLSRASGNYAELVAPPDAPPETVKQIEQNLGLDKPLINQYVDYMGDLVHGDLGQSFAYRKPVRTLIADALPNTIELGVCAFAFAAVLGVAIGVRSAMKPGGWTDHVGKGLALAGFSLASLTRLTRSAILEVLRKDHTLFMNAKGVSPRLLVMHTLRNASLPIVTLAGILLGTLISASVIVETIFAWPGVGQLAIQGINSRDYNVVQGVVLVNTAIFVMLLFLVDVSYGLLDPRVRRLGRGVASTA